ncbi:glycoside hydrolase family 3 C-terminal domain-containing protein, partial [bacterium]|nr:glycoside hydrolase family 3 C-terminal domain-containing protein [bacterium]
INDAVTRILRVKIRSGLFDTSRPSLRTYANDLTRFNSAEHKSVARQSVRESLVLLKNSSGLLPLSPSANVLVAGSGANNIPMQCGGWTVTWQGTGTSNADFPQATSIWSGIEAAVTAAGGTVNLSTAGVFDVNAPPDVAVVVFGESPYAESGGDLSGIEYQAGNKSDLALLQSLKAQNIPVVSIFLSGRPFWMNKELNASTAFVMAWLPGSEGAGVADVIFRTSLGAVNHDFTGTLSYSWPASDTQFELNRNDANYAPLFAYGFGLTYQDSDTLGDNLAE